MKGDIRSFFSKPAHNPATKKEESKAVKQTEPTSKSTSRNESEGSKDKTKTKTDSKTSVPSKPASSQSEKSQSKKRTIYRDEDVESDDDDFEDDDDVKMVSKKKAKQTTSASSKSSAPKRKIEPEHVELDEDDDIVLDVSASNSKKTNFDAPKPTKARKVEPASSPSKPTKALSPRKPAKTTSPRKSSAAASAKKEPEDDPRLPLNKETIVITGEVKGFESREEVADELMRLGAKVTTSVSGRTTYLVAGHILEDGRPTNMGKKYKTAVEKGTAILEESAFLKFLDEARAKAEEGTVKVAEQKATQVSMKTSKSADVTAKASSSAKSSSSSSSSSKVASHLTPPPDYDGMLWVDKYKPTKLDDLVGNNKAVTDLVRWLQNWDRVHIQKSLKIPFNKQNPGAKAALLSGPPGIGKTTAATIVARATGYDVIELNASDARSKRVVREVVGSATHSASVMGLGSSSKNEATRKSKRVIIMDEVDGMSSDDRGGNQELIQIIKQSRVPIICICNDRQKSAVRSLANYCFDLKFQRPQAPSVTKRVLEIAKREGMDVMPNAIDRLVRSSMGDIRQIVGLLQMWKSTSNTMAFEDVQRQENAMKKDQTFALSHFDACGYLYRESQKPETFDLRFNAFFVDYDILPLMIAENYPKAANSSKRPGDDPIDVLKRLSAAADSNCDADIVSQQIRGNQRWGLLPLSAALHMRTAYLSRGNIGFPGFPEWLGKNSSRGKKKRLLTETAMHMRQRTMINSQTLRLDYLDTLRDHIVRPLRAGNVEDIDSSIETMVNYGLSRDDVFETMQEVRLENADQQLFNIPTNVKSAFTRKYNKLGHVSQALVNEQGIAGLKPTKKKKSKAGDDDNDNEGGDDNEDNDDDDDDDDIEALVKAGTSKGGKSAGKKSTASSSKAKPGKAPRKKK